MKVNQYRREDYLRALSETFCIADRHNDLMELVKVGEIVEAMKVTTDIQKSLMELEVLKKKKTNQDLVQTLVKNLRLAGVNIEVIKRV